MSFRALIEAIDLTLSKDDLALKTEIEANGAVIRSFGKKGTNMLGISIKPASDFITLKSFVDGYSSPKYELTFNKQHNSMSIRIKKGHY